MIIVSIGVTAIEVGSIVIMKTQIAIGVGAAFPDELPFVPLYPSYFDPRECSIGMIDCGRVARIHEMPMFELATFADFLKPAWLVIAAIWASNQETEIARARRLIGRAVGGQRRIRSGALIQGKQEYEIREPVALAI